MKKIIMIAVVAALVLSLGVVAYAANNNRTSQPETTQSEQFSAEAPQMDGEKPSDLPEMNGEHPDNGGLLNDLLSNGIITQAEYDALSEAIAE